MEGDKGRQFRVELKGMTPYDWQESIGQRSQYVESRLTGGLPAIAVSLEEGILIASLRRQGQKIFEIYDSLAVVSLGVQADVEALRVGAIEFCHREGYQRSAEDVTLKRLVSGLSSSVKTAFADLRLAPFVARALFSELGSSPAGDRFVVLDYDGDYQESRLKAALAGTNHSSQQLLAKLEDLESKPLDEALTQAESILRGHVEEGEALFEAAILTRKARSDRRLKWLAGKVD